MMLEDVGSGTVVTYTFSAVKLVTMSCLIIWPKPLPQCPEALRYGSINEAVS